MDMQAMNQAVAQNVDVLRALRGVRTRAELARRADIHPGAFSRIMNGKQQWTAWLALAGWCGLRAGEIARLRAEDIVTDDIDGDTVLRVDGKGGKERIVPIPDVVVALLRGPGRRGRLFIRPGGTPATPNHVTTTTSEFFKQLGLPYTLHQLRHRFGTELYRVCRDIRLVQDLMGHATPATTAGYVAIARGRNKSIDRLGRTLPKAS